jgi:DNA-binding MarR family transcriptional regulator
VVLPDARFVAEVVPDRHRRPDPHDRRRHLVSLTTAGTDLVARLRRDGGEVERGLLACLNQRERNTLHRLLLELHRSIDDG